MRKRSSTLTSVAVTTDSVEKVDRKRRQRNNRIEEPRYSNQRCEPPTLATAAAGLAPIADANEARRSSTARPRHPQRHVLPRNRRPGRAAIISATGHNRSPALFRYTRTSSGQSNLNLV